MFVDKTLDFEKFYRCCIILDEYEIRIVRSMTTKKNFREKKI